ncbi:MAG TPA: hypothetical protein PKY30_20255, partial [Myxococcota bacterium]|nr:hypothetical protein [Myxococcota bacterium]
MMALLDPYLFDRPLRRDGTLSPEEEENLAADLEDVWEACTFARARLVQVESYWEPLWQELILPLQNRLLTRPAKNAIGQLRKLQYQNLNLPEASAGTRLWGFNAMFPSNKTISTAWRDRMATAAVSLVARGEDLLLLTRLQHGRNMMLHRGKEHVEIEEVVRWRISVRLPKAAASAHIPCIRHRHQLERPWSTRYDHRLPVAADGSRYPFCIPPYWNRRSTVAVRTTASAPAWLDAAGRAWTRPNIPGGAGYHWDVYTVGLAEQQTLGVDQLNVVEFGAPSAEGKPGHLHHVPTTKASRVH